jgi:hypothetical protein
VQQRRVLFRIDTNAMADRVNVGLRSQLMKTSERVNLVRGASDSGHHSSSLHHFEATVPGCARGNAQAGIIVDSAMHLLEVQNGDRHSS